MSTVRRGDTGARGVASGTAVNFGDINAAYAGNFSANFNDVEDANTTSSRYFGPNQAA